jgi:hypothetical protein
MKTDWYLKKYKQINPDQITNKILKRLAQDLQIKI